MSVLFFANGETLSAAPTAAQQKAAALALIKRAEPKIAAQFVVKMIPQEKDHGAFEIESSGRKIVLRGSSGIAVASTLRSAQSLGNRQRQLAKKSGGSQSNAVIYNGRK